MMLPSNCLFFALRLYFRRRRRGFKGWVTSRVSPHYPGPHFLYARMRRDGTLQLVSYKPRNPRKRLLPPPLFYGHVAWGDDPALL